MWDFVKFLIRNLIVILSLQILVKFLSKCYRTQKKTAGKRQRLGLKIFFPECVACLCLTFGTFFCLLRFLRNLVIDVGDDYRLHYQSTYTYLLGIQLTFGKRLVYKDFVLKQTILLAFLPWPSRKYSTIVVSSNSNWVFLTCQIMSGKSYPLVGVGSLFRKEMDKCLLHFFLKSLFLQS